MTKQGISSPPDGKNNVATFVMEKWTGEPKVRKGLSVEVGIHEGRQIDQTGF